MFEIIIVGARWAFGLLALTAFWFGSSYVAGYVYRHLPIVELQAWASFWLSFAWIFFCLWVLFSVLVVWIGGDRYGNSG